MSYLCASMWEEVVELTGIFFSFFFFAFGNGRECLKLANLS